MWWCHGTVNRRADILQPLYDASQSSMELSVLSFFKFGLSFQKTFAGCISKISVGAWAKHVNICFRIHLRPGKPKHFQALISTPVKWLKFQPSLSFFFPSFWGQLSSEYLFKIIPLPSIALRSLFLGNAFSFHSIAAGSNPDSRGLSSVPKVHPKTLSVSAYVVHTSKVRNKLKKEFK